MLFLIIQILKTKSNLMDFYANNGYLHLYFTRIMSEGGEWEY